MSAVASIPPKTLSPSVDWEKIGVGGVIFAWLVCQLHLVRNSAFVGQDYGFHYDTTHNFLTDPSRWFYLDSTVRPLIYWIGAYCESFTNGKYGLPLAAIVLTVMSAISLLLFHDSSRAILQSAWLRVLLLAGFAFLPCVSIAAVVYSSDAVSFLPFAAIGWLLIRSLNAASTKAAISYAACLALALVVGNFAKATFAFSIVAIVFSLAASLRWKLILTRRAILLLAVTLPLPMATSAWLYRESRRQTADEETRHTFDWRGTGEMSFRSFFFFKAADKELFSAPTYYEKMPTDAGEIQPFLVDNHYSYPGLLQAGLFTDILDVAANNSAGQRVPGKILAPRKFARIAVKTGLIFSLPAAAVLLMFCWSTVKELIFARRPLPLGLLTWVALSLVWAGPIVLTLPFVHHVYGWGYWLPRLIAPAQWGFSLLLAAAVDRFSLQHPWAIGLTGVLVIGQIGLNGLSLWY